ncbi:MAG TPA: hypothetical protein VGO93_21005 [Candidatus Xenobia bacterium]
MTDDLALRDALTPKLGFAPTITRPTDQKLIFVGGRTETINSHPACSLVFKHDTSWVEMYEWPVGHPESLTFHIDYHGNHLCQWFQGNLECWAITPASMDINEFTRCVGLLRAKMGD